MYGYRSVFLLFKMTKNNSRDNTNAEVSGKVLTAAGMAAEETEKTTVTTTTETKQTEKKTDNSCSSISKQ